MLLQSLQALHKHVLRGCDAVFYTPGGLDRVQLPYAHPKAHQRPQGFATTAVLVCVEGLKA
jgi:hypothetical protein